jgi:endoglucanase
MFTKTNTSIGKARRFGFRIRELCVISVFVLFGGALNPATSYYTTSGQNIVDRVTGKPATLRGLGLGCWLLPEGYMFGGGSIDRPRYFEKAVIDLIGPTDAREFWRLWYKNFLVEEDIKDMRRWGCTAVRPALSHSMIQPRDSQPNSPPYKYDDLGWEILDSLVTWCERWHMGIIWDMHAAPGAQGNQNIDDSDGEARLWKDTATYWPRNRDLWYKIAQRYINRKCIVGYDLLNEPLLTNIGYNGSLLRKIYVSLTDTIRKIDTAGIIFVEGQWWARDFAILEPLTWDKHLAIAFHEYPPVASDANMRGNANGTPYDWLALRTKYTIPLWHGETGEQGSPFTRNVQATDYCNANNIGWSWWTHKKFGNSTQPWNAPKTSGFQTCLDYWNNRTAKPAVTQARDWLFDQARRTNRTYCTFLPAMVTSLHPLNPNAPDTLKPWFPSSATAPGISGQPKINESSIRLIGQRIEIRLPQGELYNVRLYSVAGRDIISLHSKAGVLSLETASLPTGTYIVHVVSAGRSVDRRIVVGR